MTNIIVTTATEYFGLTQASKKLKKGWWSKDIKQAKTEVKEAGRKNNNIIEPIFDETTNEYIFKDTKLSEKLIQHHIEKLGKRSYNASVKEKIE